MAFETTFSELNSRHPTAAGPERWTRLLLGAVDASLAGCIFAVPMMLGGRHALGISSSPWRRPSRRPPGGAGNALIERPYWRRSAAHLLLLAAIGLVVQVTPLPGDWTRGSPKTGDVLSGATTGRKVGPLRSLELSISPRPGRTPRRPPPAPLLRDRLLGHGATHPQPDDVEKLLRFTRSPRLAWRRLGSSNT